MIPVTPVPFWQYFDFIILAVFWTIVPILLFLQRKQTGSLMSSISQSVAHSKKSHYIYAIMMTVIFPLYIIFLWQWLGPHVQAPPVFYYLLIIAIVAGLIFIWTPATKGLSRKIHEGAVAIIGALMFFVPITILSGDYQPNTTTSISIAFFLITPFVLFILLAFPKLRKHTFLYELAYILTFVACITLLAHT